MAQPTTSRRELLSIGTSAAAYAAGAAIVTGGVAAPSAAKGATGISPELIAAREALQRAKDDNERFSEDVSGPARARWLAACERVPHVTASYTSLGGERTLSTAEKHDVAVARSWAKVNHPGQSAMQAIVDGYEQRQAAIEALPETRDLREMNKRSDALGDHWCSVEDAFLTITPRTLADLSFKLDTVREFDIEDCAYGQVQIAEDLQAVVAAGGH